MLVLVDKCGCPGFKFTKGSTPYLVIGMVIFKDFSEAEKAGNAIKKLKNTLNIGSEFKFNKTSWKVKEFFFDKICQYDFEIRVLIADKIGLNDKNLRNNSNSFYEYLITTLIKNNDDIFSNASIKINKSIDREFKRIFTKHLDKLIEQQTLNKFRFSNSKNDSLIELTDMAIGIISKYYTDESILSYQLFNRLVENKKIKSIWKLRESS